MEKYEKKIFDECIEFLKHNQMPTIPLENSNIKNNIISNDIRSNFIKRNFYSVKIKDNNRKRIIERFGNEFGNYGICDNEKETIITLPSDYSVESALMYINTIAELAQECIKKGNCNDEKGGVIPLYYEKKFILENINKVGSAAKFWLFYNMHCKAYSLAKEKDLDKQKLRKIYALLLTIQFGEDKFIDSDMITSPKSASEELEKKGYILTEHIFKKLQ